MKILRKEALAKDKDINITSIDVLSPDIAKKCSPGQFVVLIVNEKGERIPLTVVKKDAQAGTITLIFQESGLTTKLLGQIKEGESLHALVGPLGHPTEIKKYGKVILVGGGVGIAEVYPVAEAFKQAGNHVTAIIGARNKNLLILEKQLKEASDELFITTDDSSYGRKGFVTDVLSEILLPSPQALQWDLVYAVGPIPMMKRVAFVTKEFNVKTIVSLNTLMVDATGMCGVCRVSVAGQIKFTCVDGPDFDAHAIDWAELEKRTRVYIDKEKHICRLYDL